MIVKLLPAYPVHQEPVAHVNAILGQLAHIVDMLQRILHHLH
jgi:hypothetical protein